MGFFVTFGIVIGLSHYYIFARLADYFGLGFPEKLWAGLLMVCLSFLTLLAIPLSHKLAGRAAVIFSWIAYIWMGFVLLLFGGVVLTDLCWLAVNLSPFIHDPDRLKPDFGAAALGGTTLVCTLSVWHGLKPPRIKQVDVVLKKLPPALNGFRLVQISDLHLGPLTTAGWLDKIAVRINELKPDLVAVTGDIVDGSVAELGPLAKPLGDLEARQGVYIITGNHEFYSGAESWCAYLASLGPRVLRNERVSIQSADGTASFDLAGIEDWTGGHWNRAPDLQKALEGRDTSKALVLLAHQPAAIGEAAKLGVDLQLSGHTHGGQIWPFTLLVRLQQPYVQGLYRHRGTEAQIYVSPGTGFWGPPMRFGTTAEITLMTLRSSR